MLVKFGTNSPVIPPSPAATPTVPQQEFTSISLASKPDTVHFGRHMGAMILADAYRASERQILDALEDSHEGVDGNDYLLILQAGEDIPESWVNSSSKRAIVQGLAEAKLIAINGSGEAELTPLGNWVVPNIVWSNKWIKHREELERLPDMLVLDEIQSGRQPHEEVRGRDLLKTLKQNPVTISQLPSYKYAEDEEYSPESTTFIVEDHHARELHTFLSSLVERRILTRFKLSHNEIEYDVTPYGRQVIEWLSSSL